MPNFSNTQELIDVFVASAQPLVDRLGEFNRYVGEVAGVIGGLQLEKETLENDLRATTGAYNNLIVEYNKLVNEKEEAMKLNEELVAKLDSYDAHPDVIAARKKKLADDIVAKQKELADLNKPK